MSSVLVEVIAARLALCSSSDDIHSQLERALRTVPGTSYAGGRESLLGDLLEHLWSLLDAEADEEARVRMIATICVVQNEIAR